MVSPHKAAVDAAAAILSLYEEKYGPAPFPTIKNKLMPLIEARATLNAVDNIYVQQFKASMHPIVGQVRRYDAVAGAYRPMERHGVIYLCPTLDLPWQRYLQVKEAGHLVLDKEPDWVHTDTDMDNLLIQLAQFGKQPISRQFTSELRAQAFAIELLFPKKVRDQLRARYEAGGVSPSEISRQARIPVDVVRTAMGESYYGFIDPMHDS